MSAEMAADDEELEALEQHTRQVPWRAPEAPVIAVWLEANERHRPTPP